MEKTGKVWLVGAGPSDEGLFTIKGKEVLSQAEVVVYDRLVGQGVLNLIPESARCIDVGKRAGNHTMPQEQINQVLLAEARAGKRVVRLKGGDPFLFGRGGEELELLAANGVPFEVVPGVTSAISVPAYNGIPVTHRDCASSVHIITGHRREGVGYALDFKALVGLGGTLIFLMGVSALPDICRGLLEAGASPDMPAALLIQGTTAGQRKILATLSTLEAAVAAANPETPAIILVGQVCQYGEKFCWYEKLPLFGNRVIVTRPKERSGSLAGRLRELGAEVLELPAIRTAAIPGAAREEWGRLSTYDYIVFTSPTGVSVFFDMLLEQKMDVRCLGRAKLAVLGPGTGEELEKRGLFPELMPEIYDAEHLGILLGECCGQGDRILIPRAKDGNPKLVEEIEKRCKAEIVDLPIYETLYGTSEPEREVLADPKELLAADKISMVIFTSASTVRGFAAGIKGIHDRRVCAVCIGKQTKEAAEALGMETHVAEKATIDSLVETVIAVAAQNRTK